jgi:hypothetical protein
VPVPISEVARVTPGQTKGTGTSLRSGASPLCLARSDNETALVDRQNSLGFRDFLSLLEPIRHVGP